MREPFDVIHQNRYRLSCRPDPTPDGTFLARVLISWIDDSGEAVQQRLRPEVAPFATAGEAAAAARDAAVAWLLDHAAERVPSAASGAPDSPVAPA